jgi:hypothetical protein
MIETVKMIHKEYDLSKDETIELNDYFYFHKDAVERILNSGSAELHLPLSCRNSYVVSWNDSINNIDPRGENTAVVVIIAVGTVGAAIWKTIDWRKDQERKKEKDLEKLTGDMVCKTRDTICDVVNPTGPPGLANVSKGTALCRKAIDWLFDTGIKENFPSSKGGGNTEDNKDWLKPEVIIDE